MTFYFKSAIYTHVMISYVVNNVIQVNQRGQFPPGPGVRTRPLFSPVGSIPLLDPTKLFSRNLCAFVSNIFLHITMTEHR